MAQLCFLLDFQNDQTDSTFDHGIPQLVTCLSHSASVQHCLHQIFEQLIGVGLAVTSPYQLAQHCFLPGFQINRIFVRKKTLQLVTCLLHLAFRLRCLNQIFEQLIAERLAVTSPKFESLEGARIYKSFSSTSYQLCTSSPYVFICLLRGQARLKVLQCSQLQEAAIK